MKNIVLIMTLIVSCLFAGCDSLANKSEDKLSGDDFWAQGNETNAEAFLLSIYNSFRNATMSQRPFLTYSGDMRCAPITAYSTGDKYVAYLANNDMGELRNTYPDDARGGLIMQWDVFYTAIQDANILLAEIDKVPGMDGLKRSRFKAEAIFMRNLSYFFIVRAFGDVPYYTNAYNEAPLPRTNMVIVLQNCLADLQPLLDDDPGAEVLPWSYSSYSSKGIRASRGSVIALMMHINLWLVQFDAQNKEQYYTSNSGNQIVFRYAGALLLYAEALAALGTNDTKACELLNRVRNRAHASEINTSGSELMDAIFWERCRELIGEGHYYYDLVRTGKVYNRNYCMNPMTRTNFNVGAWTWPIHRNALKNNTQIGLNLFWE